MYWLPTAANREYAKQVSLLRTLLGLLGAVDTELLKPFHPLCAGRADDIVQTRMKKMADGTADVQENLLSHMITASKDEATSAITTESFTDSLLTFMFGG